MYSPIDMFLREYTLFVLVPNGWGCGLVNLGLTRGERVTFSSPDENARAGETAPKLQYQPTPASRYLVG